MQALVVILETSFQASWAPTLSWVVGWGIPLRLDPRMPRIAQDGEVVLRVSYRREGDGHFRGRGVGQNVK